MDLYPALRLNLPFVSVDTGCIDNRLYLLCWKPDWLDKDHHVADFKCSHDSLEINGVYHCRLHFDYICISAQDKSPFCILDIVNET